MSESGVQRCDYANRRKDGDIGPVDLLEWRIAVETIVDARDGRSPHQDHDSEIVQLVAEFLHFWAVVVDDVVGCGQNEASGYPVGEGGEDENISRSCQRITQV